MKFFLSQLYSQDGTEQRDNVILDSQDIWEDIDDIEIHSSPILLTDQLLRAIQKYLFYRGSAEYNSAESVEAERAFSAVFETKLRSLST